MILEYQALMTYGKTEGVLYFGGKMSLSLDMLNSKCLWVIQVEISSDNQKLTSGSHRRARWEGGSYGRGLEEGERDGVRELWVICVYRLVDTREMDDIILEI